MSQVKPTEMLGGWIYPVFGNRKELGAQISAVILALFS
jgi:hypothetical protein